MLEAAPIGTSEDPYHGAGEFSILPDARRKHMALFGGTGTGKSTLLMNMAASDLDAGTGVTVGSVRHLQQLRDRDLLPRERYRRRPSPG
jgi:ABC-type lipoprotein export system ATPase subunit